MIDEVSYSPAGMTFPPTLNIRRGKHHVHIAVRGPAVYVNGDLRPGETVRIDLTLHEFRKLWHDAQGLVR